MGVDQRGFCVDEVNTIPLKLVASDIDLVPNHRLDSGEQTRSVIFSFTL